MGKKIFMILLEASDAKSTVFSGAGNRMKRRSSSFMVPSVESDIERQW